MNIDTDPYQNLNKTAFSEDLQPQSTMEEKDRLLQNPEGNPEDIIDDAAMIERFACGRKRLVANEHLQINYAHNSLQLSTPNGELIAIHKVAARLHYILVKKDSRYSEMIQETIANHQFIPIDTATAERGFMRYQKYEIPAGYTLQYNLAQQLWATWQDNRDLVDRSLQLDILILARSKWYRVQEMICTDDRLDLQTRMGLISVSLRDRIAWISKLGEIDKIANGNLADLKHSGSDSDLLGKIISKLSIDSLPDRHLDSKSFINSTGDLSLLNKEDFSSMLTGNNLSPTKQYLQTAAMNVLEEYLEHGETIVKTETICDADGNVISEKTITIQRGCPKWAIEAAMDWE